MKKISWVLVWGLLATGCSAIPAAVEKQALPIMPFSDLIGQANQYIGKTVILGGYVLEVRNLENETRIVAIQAPLDTHRKPKTGDLSQGLIKLIYSGFLDPETFAKNSKITVAGVLTGSSATRNFPEPYPYVELNLTHIHLWPN